MKMLSLYDAVKAVAMLLDDPNSTGMVLSSDVINNLVCAPSVMDATPVRHGRWVTEWTGEIMIVDGVKSELGIVRCSVCGGDQGKENYKYCPHCGAKMDGGE